MTTVATSTPIPGWHCTLVAEGDEKIYQCTPSHEYIAVAAYYISEQYPQLTPVQCWDAGEAQLIILWEGGTP